MDPLCEYGDEGAGGGWGEMNKLEKVMVFNPVSGVPSVRFMPMSVYLNPYVYSYVLRHSVGCWLRCHAISLRSDSLSTALEQTLDGGDTVLQTLSLRSVPFCVPFAGNPSFGLSTHNRHLSWSLAVLLHMSIAFLLPHKNITGDRTMWLASPASWNMITRSCHFIFLQDSFGIMKIVQKRRTAVCH